MADNKKTTDNNHKPVDKSESNTTQSDRINFSVGLEDLKNSTFVRNAQQPPPNPNKGKGSK
jgi:hypothetical protein